MFITIIYYNYLLQLFITIIYNHYLFHLLFIIEFKYTIIYHIYILHGTDWENNNVNCTVSGGSFTRFITHKAYHSKSYTSNDVTLPVQCSAISTKARALARDVRFMAASSRVTYPIFVTAFQRSFRSSICLTIQYIEQQRNGSSAYDRA